MSDDEPCKVKGDSNQKSALSGDEVDEKGKKIERRNLKLKDIELNVLEPTFDALHKIKRGAGVDFDKAISFLLDCGALMYNHLSNSIQRSLEEIKKSNASD